MFPTELQIMFSVFFLLATKHDSHLEFPLGWHHFAISACNLHTGVHAGSVMSLKNVSTKHTVGTDSAVIRTYVHKMACQLIMSQNDEKIV